MDRRHLASPDSSNRHTAWKHVLEGQRELPATISATPSVPNLAHHQDARAEAGVVPPVGLEPTTFGLKVRSSDQLS